MRKFRLRLGILVTAAAVLAVLIICRHQYPLLSPRLLPSVALYCMGEVFQVAYLLGRKLSYLSREEKRIRNPAYQFSAPANLKLRDHYPGAEVLHDAQTRLIQKAVGEQGGYFQLGILAATLPPLALLMLSLQLLTFPSGGAWGTGLIAAELLCLGRLAFIAMTQQRPTARWIDARLRAELIRREEYLLIARVGPYLGLKSDHIIQEADRRAGLLEGIEDAELRSLIPSHSFLNTASLAHVPDPSSPQDLLERMSSYLYLRIGKQLLWFSNEIRDCEENESLWSKVLVISLFFALIAAVAHLVHLSGETARPQESSTLDISGIVIGVLAVLLPPAATAIISIKNMYAFSGRSRVYLHQRATLMRFDGELRAIIRNCECDEKIRAGGQGTQRIIDSERSFRHIAILVEASLSNEMEKWILLMERESVEVNA